MGLADLLNLTRKIGTARQPKLTHRVVSHDSLDEMAFRNYMDDSERFRDAVRHDAPKIVMLDEPEKPITEKREEWEAYYAARDEFKAAQAEAPKYSAWEDLGHDVFNAYHGHNEPTIVERVDPGVELHKAIVKRLIDDDEFRNVRSTTRDDDTVSAVATLAAMSELKRVLTNELREQARKAEERAQAQQQAQDQTSKLQDLRDQASVEHGQGGVSQATKDAIKQAVADRRAAQQAAAAAAPGPVSQVGAEAISAAAAAGADAAEAVDGMPGLGAGLGGSEVSYQSPDEALDIAEQWRSNPRLIAAAKMFGRLDRDMRFHRSKRVIGGRDEIVDVEFGDQLDKVLPSELALLADDDTELDFLARYASGELLTFATVGEEHGGRGPIVCVIDGSGSMGAERTAWARGMAMCLLHICRRERRDFAAIEFGSAGQVATWEFPKAQPVAGRRMMEMAAHFFGGGTAPLSGMRKAQQVIDSAGAFSEADVVLIGDGDAGFGAADAEVRDHLKTKGVRIFGIGIGGSFAYLERWADHVVNVNDFSLDGPSDASRKLATHMS